MLKTCEWCYSHKIEPKTNWNFYNRFLSNRPIDKEAKADLTGADLRGAYLRGEKLDKQPLFVLGLKWDVMITKQQMKIGCEFHKVEDWWKFDNKRILGMASKEALVFWKTNKPILKKLWENHCKD